MTFCRPLPLGRSEFAALRDRDAIYVDKTNLIFDLCQEDAKIFLSRPRRFGKSLLISTMESLFRHGLRDFKGLQIEKLWNDKTYNVVRLDFSEIKEFKTAEDFETKFEELIASKFRSIGFLFETSGISWSRQFADWLAAQPVRSLVLLIDEYDAPLTSCLDDKTRFESVRTLLSDFYIKLKSNEGCLRFFFMTGITKFSNASLFSAFNNLQDISLNPRYGTLLGYTEEELRHDFAPYLEKAEASLGLSSNGLIKALQVHYDGFCFDDQARTHVFCPWSILNFLIQPELGFRNYWYESGGQPTVLMKYLVNHALADPSCYNETQELPLSTLAAANHYDDVDPKSVLTQAGYLTIKSASADGWVQLGYPNQEVSVSMARLYSAELLRGKRLRRPGFPPVADVLRQGSPADVVDYFNWIFNAIDYQNYPVTSESHCRALLQMLLVGAGLEAIVEHHTARGRSDLEVTVDHRRWVFEIKFTDNAAAVSKLLAEASDQLKDRRYGESPHGKELIRLALVFDAQERAFAAWANPDA